jgi:hypothetical protein
MHIDMDMVSEERPDGHDDVIRIFCPSVRWTFKFQSGYTVVLRGPLAAHIRIISGYSAPFPELPGFTLRCEHLQFDGETHEKLFPLDKLLSSRHPDSPSIRPASVESDGEERRYDDRYHLDGLQIPIEPVNGFGIPQATMRCLEVSLSLCVYSLAHNCFYSLRKALVK